MRHILKLACGRHNYKCVGIWSSDSSLSAIVLKIKQLVPVISVHSTNYDNTAVPVYGSSVDLIANNFYNLPRSILGIVNQTLYNDLQLLGDLVGSVVGRCRDIFNPFLSTLGLLDYFGRIALISGAFSPYKFLLASYKSDSILLPGILLPVASLSNFNPTPIAVIPSGFAAVMDMTNTIVRYGSGGTLASGVALVLANALGNSPCPKNESILTFFTTKRYKDIPSIAQGLLGLSALLYVSVPRGFNIFLGTQKLTLLYVDILLGTVRCPFGLLTSLLVIAHIVKLATYPHTYQVLSILFQAEALLNTKTLRYITLATISVIPYENYLTIRIDQPLCGIYNIQDLLLTLDTPINLGLSVLTYNPAKTLSGGYNWVGAVLI